MFSRGVIYIYILYKCGNAQSLSYVTRSSLLFISERVRVCVCDTLTQARVSLSCVNYHVSPTYYTRVNSVGIGYHDQRDVRTRMYTCLYCTYMQWASINVM